jgi:hypothetical protein
MHLDALRAVEYGRLDVHGQIYLDYTGGSLHAASQVRQHADLLNAQALGNPHSASPSSSRTTTLVEGSRRAVLEWFDATGEQLPTSRSPCRSCVSTRLHWTACSGMQRPVRRICLRFLPSPTSLVSNTRST